MRSADNKRSEVGVVQKLATVSPCLWRACNQMGSRSEPPTREVRLDAAAAERVFLFSLADASTSIGPLDPGHSRSILVYDNGRYLSNWKNAIADKRTVFPPVSRCGNREIQGGLSRHLYLALLSPRNCGKNITSHYTNYKVKTPSNLSIILSTFTYTEKRKCSSPPPRP